MHEAVSAEMVELSKSLVEGWLARGLDLRTVLDRTYSVQPPLDSQPTGTIAVATSQRYFAAKNISIWSLSAIR